jgi:hypothetical protein
VAPKPKPELKIKPQPMGVLLVLDLPQTANLVLSLPVAQSLVNFPPGLNGPPLVPNVASETLPVTEMSLLLNLVVVPPAQLINTKPNSVQLAFLLIALVLTPRLLVSVLDRTRTTQLFEPTTST